MADLSKVFSGAENPWEPGVYKVNVRRFSFWNGERWGWRMGTIPGALLHADKPASGPVRCWQGLAEKSQ